MEAALIDNTTELQFSATRTRKFDLGSITREWATLLAVAIALAALVCHESPLATYSVERLRQHAIPLWNPHVQMGIPQLSTGKTSVFSFPTLFRFLTPDAFSLPLAALAQFLIAGAGAWLLAFNHLLEKPGRLVTSSSFMLCGLLVLSPTSAAANVVTMLPWAIVATDRLLHRATPGRLAVTAIAIGLAMLGADPSAIIGMLLMLSTVTIFSIALSDRWGKQLTPLRRLLMARRIPAVIAAVGIGAALAGVQISPLVEYLVNLPSIAQPVAMHVSSLPILVAVQSGPWAKPPLVPATAALLAIFAIVLGWRLRVVRYWLAIIASTSAAVVFVVSLIAADFHPAVATALAGPGLLAGPVLAIAMLAGLGVDLLVRRLNGFDVRSLRRAHLVISTIASIAVALLFIGIIIRQSHPWMLHISLRLLTIAVVLALLCTVIHPRWKPAWESRVPVYMFPFWALLAEGLAFAMPWQIQGVPETSEPPRLITSNVNEGRVWVAQAAQAFPRRADVMAAMLGSLPVDPRKTVLIDREIDNPFDEPLTPPGLGGIGKWFEKTASAKGIDDAKILSDLPEKVEIGIVPHGGGWLVLADRFYPGWQAQVYLKNVNYSRPSSKPLTVPVAAAFECMRCILLPPEAVRVVFVYDPMSWRWGYFASAGGVLTILLLGGMTLLDNRDTHDSDGMV